MSELDDAIRYANKVLDEPYADPDSDKCRLARQFLRLREALSTQPQTSDEGTPVSVHKLKALAEQAHDGPWRSLDARDDWKFAFDGIYRVSAPDNPMPADVIKQFDNRPIVAECAGAKNARYIAAANPSAVIWLINELNREQNDHAELQARCHEGFPSASDGIFDALAESDRKVAELERTLHAKERELRIAEAKNQGTLANNLCPDHRDKQVGKPCLACEIERLQQLATLPSGYVQVPREVVEWIVNGGDGREVFPDDLSGTPCPAFRALQQSLLAATPTPSDSKPDTEQVNK